MCLFYVSEQRAFNRICVRFDLLDLKRFTSFNSYYDRKLFLLYSRNDLEPSSSLYRSLKSNRVFAKLDNVLR